MDLSGIGIWSGELRYGDEAREAGGGGRARGAGVHRGVDPRRRRRRVRRARASSSTPPPRWWPRPASSTSGCTAPRTSVRASPALEADFAGRTLLGIGVSHHLLIDNSHPGEYTKPLAKTRELPRRAGRGRPHRAAPTGACSPRSARRCWGSRATAPGGAHPYLVTPEHTEVARAELGDGPLLAPEQHVVLETDAAKARAVAREGLSVYLQLPNYVNNWRRLGLRRGRLRRRRQRPARRPRGGVGRRGHDRGPRAGPPRRRRRPRVRPGRHRCRAHRLPPGRMAGTRTSPGGSHTKVTMDIEEFYDADPRRRESEEIEFGREW